MNYTGDLVIKELDDGTYDIFFQNGQPEMTDGLETLSILAVFGQDWWGNDIFIDESQKMKSEFPNIIKRNVVNEKTKNDGTKAIENALNFLIDESIAQEINISGEIFSVYGIRWLIEIEKPSNENVKYFINWEKGSLTAYDFV